MCIEICILCGHVLCEGVGRRYKKYDVMSKLIESRCIATPFVYSCVMKYNNTMGKHTVCIACVNWTRRLSLRKSADKILIPMDNVILFVMDPGRYLEPDKRTLIRLLKSLCLGQGQYGMGMMNHYTCFQDGNMRAVQKVLHEKYFNYAVDPTGAEVVTDYYKDSIIDAIVREWWIFNGMPTILQNKVSTVSPTPFI
jgi:hypothetical protein